MSFYATPIAGEQFGGNEIPYWLHNGLLAALLVLGVLWLQSVVRRALELRAHLHSAKSGNVLVLTPEDDVPAWLDHRIVSRLSNRRDVLPRMPVDGMVLPVWFQTPLEGALDEERVVATVLLAPEVAASSCASMVLLGVARAFWNQLRAGNSVAHADWAQSSTRMSRADGSWTPLSAAAAPGRAVVPVGPRFFAGKHAGAPDDVACVVMVRSDAVTLALSTASDLRVLECVLWHAGFASALSVRDTYHEDGDDDECIVCCAEPKSTVLLPCRHLCCCATCLGRMDKCPICRSPVDSYVTCSALGADERVV